MGHVRLLLLFLNRHTSNYTSLQITVCGQILSISEQTTWNTYRLDDGSGVIEVKQWLDVQDPNANERHHKLAQHMYVRVLGQMRTVMNSPKRYIAAANAIRPVEFNEVMFHMLEATVVHLHFSRGPKEKFINAGSKGGGGDINMSGMGMGMGMAHGTKVGGAGGGSAVSGGGVASGNLSGFSPMVRKVVLYLSTVDSDGEHVNVIAQRTGLSIREVHQARDELVGGGYAFVTVDDDTLALCIDSGFGG